METLIACNCLIEMPSSNIYVAQQINTCAAHINDAIEECTCLENGECFDGTIHDLEDVERLWIQNIISLLKTTFLCMKKLALLFEASTDEAVILGADEAIMMSRSCSKFSDELVSFMDLPLDTIEPELLQAANVLAKESKNLANFGKSFSKWFSLCDSKLDSLFSSLSIK